MGNKTN